MRGRPPAAWLGLRDQEEDEELTLAQIAEIAGVTRPTALRSLARIGQKGELRWNGSRYVKVYSVAKVRSAYLDAFAAYHRLS